MDQTLKENESKVKAAAEAKKEESLSLRVNAALKANSEGKYKDTLANLEKLGDHHAQFIFIEGLYK